jgi:hypothetical protein
MFDMHSIQSAYIAAVLQDEFYTNTGFLALHWLLIDIIYSNCEGALYNGIEATEKQVQCCTASFKQPGDSEVYHLKAVLPSKTLIACP